MCIGGCFFFFKKKTAYEMLRSLVGSEMCIRDRVGVAKHIDSLGIPVLAMSLPGHYSRKAWAPVEERRPEFIIGQIPTDAELKKRLAVYTFKM